MNLLLVFQILFLAKTIYCGNVSLEFTRIWGPGLYPHKMVMPARYFFIEARNSNNSRINSSLDEPFKVVIEGPTKDARPCRVWINTLDRKDGTYIVRYKIFEECLNLKISVMLLNQHIAQSPYELDEQVVPDQCNCPEIELNEMIQQWNCGKVPSQLMEDLKPFENISWDSMREKLIIKYDKPFSVSLCHYVIKSNQVYRNCYGKYTGFKMFMDSILLSLTRKVFVPDSEFFVNLGDWPLVPKNDEKFPVFSWCGSTDTLDIVMPTYDITESTLENMGRVMLDMLSVQGNTVGPWDKRLNKAFWRGRDSSKERLNLIKISRKYPEIFNCSLTNFFFFRDEEAIYGPKSEHISFYRFFDYKYQLGLDGTVAAYRFPYLLAGGSLVFKQDSQYYEHFYNNLIPYVHYIPIKRNLEDLVEKIQWAIENDIKAKEIAEQGRSFSNEYLLPQSIFCYYSHLINEFSKRLSSSVNILNGMEKVEQPQQDKSCDCNFKYKDEL